MLLAAIVFEPFVKAEIVLLISVRSTVEYVFEIFKFIVAVVPSSPVAETASGENSIVALAMLKLSNRTARIPMVVNVFFAML